MKYHSLFTKQGKVNSISGNCNECTSLDACMIETVCGYSVICQTSTIVHYVCVSYCTAIFWSYNYVVVGVLVD